MYFEIVGPITDVETIAAGRSIRQLPGRADSTARVGGVNSRASPLARIASGELRRAEVHWCEAHGMGRVRHKIKRFLD